MLKEITEIVNSGDFDEKTVSAFLERVGQGKPTRDENPQTHFCVYFAAFDKKAKKGFMGHHKKSGLWLFGGGHIDKGEFPLAALKREIAEEWGINVFLGNITPELLTVTEIEKRPVGLCRRHYDIWYFVELDKNEANFDREKLDQEFHQTRWLSIDQALGLATDPNTIKALKFLKKRFAVK